MLDMEKTKRKFRPEADNVCGRKVSCVTLGEKEPSDASGETEALGMEVATQLGSLAYGGIV